jgi:hypothetical protein
LGRRFGGPQRRTGFCGEKKNLTPAGKRTPAIEPVAIPTDNFLNLFCEYLLDSDVLKGAPYLEQQRYVKRSTMFIEVFITALQGFDANRLDKLILTFALSVTYIYICKGCRDSSVGIPTGYGLDG